MIVHEAPGKDVELTALSRADLMLEFMLNALRLNDGFAENVFVARTGLSTDELENATAEVRRKGLLERGAEGIWRPTDLGKRFLNDLQSEFIAEED